MEDETKKLVSVIIVTSGAKDYLLRCLDSVKQQTYAHLEVIVIDNSLKPNLAAKLREHSPSVKLYSSIQNLYYGASLNKGIGLSRGEFILCLNDEVSLDKDFIGEALKGFLVKEAIGMVSGKILRTDGLTLDSTGLFLSIWRTAKERGYAKLDQGQFEKSGFIFGVSGAAAFYRRSMLKEIAGKKGYFDQDFRMFYEDLDISWRANNYGWRAYYMPKARAFHLRGGSFRPDSGLGKPFARKYLNDELHADLIKNRYLTVIKNEAFFSLLLHLAPMMLYDLCAWAYILFFRPKVIKIFFSNARYLLRVKKKG